MKDENLIHIRLTSGELLQSKRDMLRTEIDLLRILQTLKKYKEIREKELETKLEVLKRLKAIKEEIVYIETVFPKLKLPKILQDEKEKDEFKPSKEKVMKKVEKERKYGDEIEEELRLIQNKLRELQ